MITEGVLLVKTVEEKIAYLKGLMEGGDFYAKDPASRAIWEQLLAILDDLARATSALQHDQEELEEYVEAIDSDLMDVEDQVYNGVDEDYVQMECPNCGKTVSFEEDFLYDDDVEVTCPECGGVIYVGDNYVDPESFGTDGEDESED